jgi:hypothetical protein
MRRINDWGVALSALALAGTALLLGAAVTRATLRTPAVAAPAPEAPQAVTREGQATAGENAAAEALPSEALSLAVERAPFDPDRRAPDQRYLMPGERVAQAPVRVERPEPPPPPDFRVLGTVAGPNGGVAVIAVEDQPPRVLAMGSEISGYRVAAIDGGRVVMSGQGRNLALEVPEALPGGTAANVERNERGGNNNQRGNQRSQNQQREVERAQNQVRERLEQLTRQMRESGQPFQMEMNGDRAIITGPNGLRREIQLPDNVGRVQISPQGNVTFQRGRGAGGGGE